MTKCYVINLWNNPYHRLLSQVILKGFGIRCSMDMYVQRVSNVTPALFKYSTSGYFTRNSHKTSQGIYFNEVPYKYEPGVVSTWLKGVNHTKNFSNDFIINLLGDHVSFQVNLLEQFPKHRDSFYFSVTLAKFKSWVNFHIEKQETIRILKTVEIMQPGVNWQKVKKIHPEKIPQFSVGSFKGSNPHFNILIEMQVSFVLSKNPNG